MTRREDTVVVKIGTSSITDDEGVINRNSVGRLCDGVATLRASGRRVVVVTSGAIAAGLPELNLGGDRRPRDSVTLQAISAVGQGGLIRTYREELGRHGLITGQVLLAPLDFFVRAQYLHARGTLNRLLELGVVPVVNENDAIADDEIRFGDNDRIAALVAHLVEASTLILLTDTPGLFTADPRLDLGASLISEIVEIDHELENLAGATGSGRGSGGMASKLAAAKIASWSGVRTVIADAARDDVMVDACDGKPGVGTVVRPREANLGARRLWIAFAVGSSGQVTVDAGARRALEKHRVSLLPAGVLAVEGTYDAGSAVEVCDPSGSVFAKGIVRHDSAVLRAHAGCQTGDLPDGIAHEAIHADDLVVLPG
ncbi:MAG: glutamate 5-kinase [Acidimicrobiales bacterium]|nr:glutamate 5-kinase [Acidimicrobiales bacterium]